MNHTKTTYISANWRYGYSGIEELTKQSDLIAFIKVNTLSENIPGRVPASIFDVTVTDAIYGCTDSEKLCIYMTGGKSNAEIFVVDTDPSNETRTAVFNFCSEK